MNPSEFRSLPDFLCIGAQKAATSWLWTMLRQHPEIWMPPIKELHFFDHLYVPENRAWTHFHIKKGVNDALKWHFNNNTSNLEQIKYLVDTAMVDPFTEDWYKFCFNRPGAQGKILGDITPEYSTLPDEGIEYVKRLLGPKLRIIYIIRNPVERALSQLRMNQSRRGKDSDGEEVWMNAAKEPVIAQRGDYATYVGRWEKHFPETNILYLPYKMVKNSPEKLLQNVESFIGASQSHPFNNINNVVHKTKQIEVPSRVVDYLTSTLEPQSIFLKGRFGENFFANT
jgi:hypothetical protein